MPGSTIWGSQNRSPSLHEGRSEIINQAFNPAGISETNHQTIQLAAYYAILQLTASGLVSFGSAPMLQVYLIAKTTMSAPNLSLSEFLAALNSSKVIRFQMIHDDLGSVTHVRLDDPTMQPEQPGIMNMHGFLLRGQPGLVPVSQAESSLFDPASGEKLAENSTPARPPVQPVALDTVINDDQFQGPFPINPLPSLSLEPEEIVISNRGQNPDRTYAQGSMRSGIW